MMSFKAIESADGAAHYFESSDDYYGSEGENTQDGLDGHGGGAAGGDNERDAALRVDSPNAVSATRPGATPAPGKLGHKGVWAGKGAAALGLDGKVDREVVLLWAWEGLLPQAIAEVMGLTPNAVSIRLYRAKKSLAGFLERKSAALAGQRLGKEGSEL